MKITKINLCVVIASILVYGCYNQTNSEVENTHKLEDNQPSGSEKIQLNQGEKWIINKDMKPFILEAENMLNDYINSNSSNFKTLAAQLKEKNSGLIKSCTMQGQSHDELHKWLLPHIELIKKLEQCDIADDAEYLIVEVKKSFEKFHKYFN